MKRNARILALLLCIIIMVFPFVSCGDKGDAADTTVAAQELVQIDLSEYKVIRPTYAGDILIADVVTFRTALSEKLGIEIGIAEDYVKDVSLIDDNAKEILVGATNRSQSQTAIEGLDEGAFTIAIIGNKIVINAAKESVVKSGLDYFLQQYVTETDNGGVLSFPENLKYVSDTIQSLDIVKDGVSEFTIIRSDDDDSTNAIDAIQNIRDQISVLTGVSLNLGTDFQKTGTEPDSTTYEILVGSTNRPETIQVLSNLNVAQYGAFVIGNKIVVTGWNSTTTELAVAEFNKILKSNREITDDDNKNISLLSGSEFIYTYEKWQTDIPEYDGGKLTDTANANNDSYQLYYTETTLAEYEAYKQKLATNGYTLHFENVIEGNSFATYYNTDVQIHTYYVDYLHAVRTIVQPLGNLAPTDDQSYTKITETKITQLCLNYDADNFGNSYIITLEDGSFIVYDGGGSYGNDYVNMYNTLKELNERADGKIVIAAWILTHDHWDHVSVFDQVATNYASSIQLEYLIVNAPAEQERLDSGNPGTYTDSKMFTALAKFSGAKFIKVQTGEVLKFRNAEIEVLYTHNDLLPTQLTVFNDSTTLTRLSAGGQTMMFLGDLQTAGCKVAVAMYGDYLKSDFVQVAHHGWNGSSMDMYKAIAPTLAFWPTDQSSFESQTSNTSLSYYNVDHYIRYNLGVKEILVADETNKTITLPYTAGSNSYVTN